MAKAKDSAYKPTKVRGDDRSDSGAIFRREVAAFGLDPHRRCGSLSTHALSLISHISQKGTKTSTGKKKLTGFMLFSKENREKVRGGRCLDPTVTPAAVFLTHHLCISPPTPPQVKSENPGIAFGQIGKKLGEMWRALSDKEKQAYKDRKE